MSIVGGLDVHRNQITYDWVDHATGETAPRAGVTRNPGDVRVMAGHAAGR